MFNFKKAELCDSQRLCDAFKKYRDRVCDYSTGNVLFWRDYYDISFSLDDDCLILKYDNMGARECFAYPVSDRPIENIKELLNAHGSPLCLSCLTEDQLDKVTANFKICDVIHSEDWDDYLYLAKDIVTLGGRRYSGQRNHINKFKKSYHEHRFEEITSENTDLAKKFCTDYFDNLKKSSPVFATERAQLIEMLDNWDGYLQRGGLLLVDGQAVGISIGEMVGDTLIVHVEKADTSYDGVYPMLTNCFARKFATGDECLYINREEDCGEEGLRISKRSYHPIEIIKKYGVVITE